MASGGAKKMSGKPGIFPNDSEMRGKDRKLRRTLPDSNGNPRQVSGAFEQGGRSITPEGFGPDRVLSAPHGKFGLSAGSGDGP